MSEETRWKVLMMARERKDVSIDAAIEWLQDIENESDDPEVAYAQLCEDMQFS